MEGNERTEPPAGKDSNVPDQDGENNAEPHSTHSENDSNCHVPSTGEKLYCKILNKFKAWNFIGKIFTQPHILIMYTFCASNSILEEG